MQFSWSHATIYVRVAHIGLSFYPGVDVFRVANRARLIDRVP